jgi:thiol-disulfide isomerase/thioredoxin
MMTRLRFALLPALLALVLASRAAAQGADAAAPAGGVAEVTTTTLDAAAATRPVLLMLHASWCGHCRRFMPAYRDVAAALAGKVVVARADGSTHRVLSQRFGVTGFPSFYLLDGGRAYEYGGPRSVDGLVEFARSHGGSAGAEMVGLSAPLGVYWRAASTVLVRWERVVEAVQAADIPPAAAVGGAVLFLVGVLATFGLAIHFGTRPAERPKRE